MGLEDLRQQLNRIDDEIADCLRRRAALAVQVRDHKQNSGEAVYQPERERAILERIANSALGDYPVASALVIFREIIAACRALQMPPRVAYLGPAGTFTEIAARQLYSAIGEYLPQPDFPSVFDAVCRGDVDFGVVPVENSTAGTIREVLDLLAGQRLTIVAETFVDVHHCLLSRAQLHAIRVVYSKDTALLQCQRWLAEHLPHAVLETVPSTSVGAARAADDPTAAAVAPAQAADVYELPVLARNIEDRGDNRTRFFALGRETPPPSGADKTSLLISVAHQPGALVTALTVLQAHGLNMTLIESRPSPSAAFEYLFFIDIEGHCRDDRVAAALEELKRVTQLVQVLGSYPRAAG